MAPRPILAFSQPDYAAAANHRVANNLSMVAGLVRMQASSIGDKAGTMEGDEVRMVLEGLGGRVDTIARLHRTLSNGPSGDSIDLGDYVRDITDAIVTALSFAGQVKLRFSCDRACTVSSRVALSLGLIVVEIVTNAVKFAHPTGVAGEIAVACRRSGDAIVIEVSDDGVGLPEGFDPISGGHLGLRLVRSLAAQLVAQISFESGALGTSFELRVPSAVSA